MNIALIVLRNQWNKQTQIRITSHANDFTILFHDFSEKLMKAKIIIWNGLSQSKTNIKRIRLTGTQTVR